MPRDSQVNRLLLGSPLSAPRGYGGGGGDITSLLLEQGRQQADAARAQGEIWSGAVQQAGQQIAGGFQQVAEEKKLKTRDAKWLSVINDPEVMKDPRRAYAASQELFGPEGDKHFQSLVAMHQMAQPKRNPEADQKALVAFNRGYKGLDPETRAKSWGQVRPLIMGAFGTELPEQYDEDQYTKMWAPAIEGLEPKKAPVKGSPGDVFFDQETGEQKFAVPPEVKPHKKYEVEVPGPGGTKVKRLATEEEMAKGVQMYREPRAPKDPNLQLIERVGPDGKTVKEFVQPKLGMSFETPAKAAPQQRLTKDERQDFASWDYALPKLEEFTKYVEENRGKFGSFDSMMQSAKQKLPGFVDSDFASKKALVNRTNAMIGHAIYGSAYTGNEQQKADGFLVTEDDQPEVIIAKTHDAMNRAKASIEYYRGLGFNMPAAPGGGGAQAAPPTTPIAQMGAVPQDTSGPPRRVSSRAEVDALPSGAFFITPDGKMKQKP